MLWTVIISFWFAGLVALWWQRIIAATDFGNLSWLFLPLERFIGTKHDAGVRFTVGLIVWLGLSPILAIVYWVLVEQSILTYYDFSSVGLFVFVLYVLSNVVLLPAIGYGIGGWRLSNYVWFESLIAWLLFAGIVTILVQI